ncbi:sulfatase [Blastopirellula sp. JC732]|uniref:Sulfatase n=1 Tax=Blastopirellula sediminis TaxID=2894196 RepID=A0A9X1MTI6_9BACT|nr:sulfatase [Blastopirellula sediminis]MCC9604566.1 sulfatase [Blastopirellula sediminis]MCC9632135.1 sulfatase [Blastopirellula sediminis]
MLRTFTLAAAALVAVFACSSVSFAADEAKLPNIVVIFIDDMAYADIGPFGATAYPTPHLDELAKEGTICTDFYVTQAVCSASRCGLLTGCYNNRLGILGALGPKSKIGLNPEETTLAEICKQKDYATAIYGKWHLGDEKEFLPLQHGFDDYVGLPYSNDMWPYHPGLRDKSLEQRKKTYPDLPLISKNEIIDAEVTPEEQRNLTTLYTEKAVEFIDDHAKQPFFLYVPHSMVHVPLYVSDKFAGKSGAGLFGDVVMEVDWSVGQIMEALRRNKVDDNTLVIFTSDNGPWLSYGEHAGSAGPLREGKGTMWDGGCREPTIFWMPGKIPAGKSVSTPMMTIDILPTVAQLIGAKLPDHKIDGKNIWPIVTGQPGAKSPHEAYYMYYGDQLQAIRSGKWKLHFPHGYRTLNGRPGGKDGLPVNYEQAHTGLALYDLESDIGETIDVKDSHPDVVARLQKLADEARADLGDGLTKTKGSGLRPVGRVK